MRFQKNTGEQTPSALAYPGHLSRPEQAIAFVYLKSKANVKPIDFYMFFNRSFIEESDSIYAIIESRMTRRYVSGCQFIPYVRLYDYMR